MAELLEFIRLVIFYLGVLLVILGAILDFIGALGLLRFPNFFVRLHASTVGCVGGGAYPIFGAGLIIMSANIFGDWGFFAGIFVFLIAGLTFLATATSSHALARAAHRSKTVPVQPKFCDHLEEDRLRVRGV
ncbi:MAG: monovalent cation/H(+) antiporter subunit G [Nitrososphaerota archaeon]|nr:monovalent cation/H(+) antiporter subunit G [Nitrososphaerales archaeon]MDW8044496.1 monovalent cation/H(+) antiporter subunit G [Nitrososphaerota archaeon]